MQVRIKPDMKCKTYTMGGRVYHKGAGWFVVEDSAAEVFRGVLVNPSNPDSGAVFEVRSQEKIAVAVEPERAGVVEDGKAKQDLPRATGTGGRKMAAWVATAKPVYSIGGLTAMGGRGGVPVVVPGVRNDVN